MRGKNRKIKYEDVYTLSTLFSAVAEGSKGKHNKWGYVKYAKRPHDNIGWLQRRLKHRTWKASKPKMEEMAADHNKTRLLAKVPFFPDHVVHHALMQVCMPQMTRSYYYDSYASIKGKGIHMCAKRVRLWIDRHKGEKIVFSQLDFTKFYHKIDQEKALTKLRRFYFNHGIQWLFSEIIHSLDEGLAIGFYPIQPIANFYLNDLDRLPIFSKYGIKVFRYCDNILLLGTCSTKQMWQAVHAVLDYANDVLEQPMHQNLFVRPLSEKDGIDMVGYVQYTNRMRVRKTLKQRFARSMKRIKDPERKRQVLASYKGWLMFSHSLHLWKKITGMKSFKELNIKVDDVDKFGNKMYDCDRLSPKQLLNRPIVFIDAIMGVETKEGKDRCVVVVEENGQKFKFITNNQKMKHVLAECKEKGHFPFQGTLRVKQLANNINDYYIE